MNRRFPLISLTIWVALLATACLGEPQVPASPLPSPTTDISPPLIPSNTPSPLTTEVLASTEPETGVAAPGLEPLPPDPVRIEFQAEDGTPLVGEYFPSGVNPAPTVVLMHQMGSNRKVWLDLGMVSWLTNRGGEGGGLFAPLLQSGLWPPMPQGLTFAVFAFDFRQHGESGGAAQERREFLMDVQAALEIVKGLEGVDAGRFALIGASIGADAAVDACGQGCLGGLSLSPGSYLEVPYSNVVTEMALDGKPAWCIASQEDSHSAQTCDSTSGANYRKVIYPGYQHGTNILVPGLDPDVGRVILDFLLLTFGLTA